MKTLFDRVRIGDLELKNRIVMAPMTRSRAGAENVPSDLAARYYAQRASAGLIIAEATQVHPQGIGYINTPGIYTAAQIEGWRRVTDAVHRAGGAIFLQLWHVGRVSHPDFHGGALPVAPSAVEFEAQVFTPEGFKPAVVPRELTGTEIREIVEMFRDAATNAQKAGFDGVEIHGANGYLPDQFLRDGANKRTDEYGGSIENRARFMLEITAAAVEVWGRERVGVRISPFVEFAGISDSNPRETFAHITRKLDELGIGYLHVMEFINQAAESQDEHNSARITPFLKTLFSNLLIVNGGYDYATGTAAVERGEADLVSYGAPFLANPDLLERFRLGAPLNAPDKQTFYGGGERGYTDYPTLAEEAQKSLNA